MTRANAEDSTRHLISREQLFNGVNHLFQGKEYGGVPVSFFWMRSPPGSGPRLHKHRYQEIFVVEDGLATFTLGDETTTVEGGHVVISQGRLPINSLILATRCSS